MGLYKRGKIWWTAETVKGSRYRVSTGKTDREEAKVRAAEILAEQGGKPKAAPRPRRILKNPPVSAVIEAYVQHQLEAGYKLRSYRLLTTVWRNTIGKYLVADVSSDLITSTLKDLTREHNWSDASRAVALAELSGMFTFARKRGWITIHPAREGRVARPAVDNARERWLQPVEIARIKTHCPAWLGDIVDFAVGTCRRLGEIVELTATNIHMDVNDRPYLVTEPTKNRRRVRIPLPAGLGELVKRKLAEAKTETGRRHAKGDKRPVPLFPGPSWGSARTSICRNFKKAVQSAGLPYGRGRDEVSFHTLRHTGASIMANAGVRLQVIQRIGGWRDRKMVERYSHLGDEVLTDAMIALDKIVKRGNLSQLPDCHTPTPQEAERESSQDTVN